MRMMSLSGLKKKKMWEKNGKKERWDIFST